MTMRVTLGEDISRLVNKGDGEQLEIAFLKMLVSDVVVNLNVLGAFMEDIIMSIVDSTTIVTIKRSGSGLWSIACGVGKGTILSLSTGTGNNILLLATP